MTNKKNTTGATKPIESEPVASPAIVEQVVAPAEPPTGEPTMAAPDHEQAAAAPADNDMQPYFDAYPHNAVFYRTSDKMMFLANDKHLAENHQRTMPDGQLETINRPQL